MRNTILKTISTMLAILMLALFTQTSVSAQENVRSEEKGVERSQEDLSLQRGNPQALEGVWNHINTRRNCVTGEAIQTFAAMHTFMSGGTMSDWGAGTPPSLRSNGQGIWSYQSLGIFSTAFQFFRFNPDGTYAGKQVVREQIELSPDGNSYESTATAQVIDTIGNVIANNCATGTATRFE